MIQNMPTSWRRFKRNAKLNPEIVQRLYNAYLEKMNARELTRMPSQVVRSAIVKELAADFSLDYYHIRKILCRESWAEQPIPDNWIPFI